MTADFEPNNDLLRFIVLKCNGLRLWLDKESKEKEGEANAR